MPVDRLSDERVAEIASRHFTVDHGTPEEAAALAREVLESRKMVTPFPAGLGFRTSVIVPPGSFWVNPDWLAEQTGWGRLDETIEWIRANNQREQPESEEPK